jgi:hypothetical protein
MSDDLDIPRTFPDEVESISLIENVTANINIRPSSPVLEG